MVINCNHVWNCISEYLDGTLSERSLRVVQNHLDCCKVCPAILDSTRNIILLTADNSIFEPPIGFSERLHARIDREFE